MEHTSVTSLLDLPDDCLGVLYRLLDAASAVQLSVSARRLRLAFLLVRPFLAPVPALATLDPALNPFLVGSFAFIETLLIHNYFSLLSWLDLSKLAAWVRLDERDPLRARLLPAVAHVDPNTFSLLLQAGFQPGDYIDLLGHAFLLANRPLVEYGIQETSWKQMEFSPSFFSLHALELALASRDLTFVDWFLRLTRDDGPKKAPWLTRAMIRELGRIGDLPLAERIFAEVFHYELPENETPLQNEDFCFGYGLAEDGHLPLLRRAVESQNYHMHDLSNAAAAGGQLEVLRFLETLGLDLAAEKGRLLETAARNGQVELCKFFVAQGAPAWKIIPAMFSSIANPVTPGKDPLFTRKIERMAEAIRQALKEGWPLSGSTFDNAISIAGLPIDILDTLLRAGPKYSPDVAEIAAFNDNLQALQLLNRYGVWNNPASLLAHSSLLNQNCSSFRVPDYLYRTFELEITPSVCREIFADMSKVQVRAVLDWFLRKNVALSSLKLYGLFFEGRNEEVIQMLLDLGVDWAHEEKANCNRLYVENERRYKEIYERFLEHLQ